MTDKASKWLHLIVLIVLYVAIGTTKSLLTFASPYYDTYDETNLHFTENAVQYRYAKMIAKGEGIPETDTRIQHPEGVRVAEELTITLERVSGWLYRILAQISIDPPFHTYSVYFIAFFSSLAVFPLYLGASRLWGGWLSGHLAVAFYAVMPPAWLRTITSFSREDFTLTFLFTGLVCFGLSLGERRERWMPWAAGFAFSIAAISWHITNFVLAILFLYAVVTYLTAKEERNRILESLWPIVAMLFLAGTASDLLTNKWFVTSTTMLIAYGLIAAHLLGEHFKLGLVQRVGILIGLPIALHLALSATVGENYRAYSHAFDVIYYKLRFGLIKPTDPTLMNYDARGMWSSSFRSPSLDNVWSMFSTLLLVSLAAAALAVRDLRRGGLDASERFILYCFAAFLAGYIAFDRLQVFLVFFAALFATRWLVTLAKRRHLAVFGLCAFIVYEIHNDTRLFITIHRSPGLDPLVEWVRENTGENDVILTAFHIAPSILTYTNRPVIQHPKFESHVIRKKSERFLNGLFSTEKDFFGLAQEWEADYYVYGASMGLDTSTESPRYVAGRTSVPDESALFHFHFAPDELQHFHLVYQDSYYRVFKVGDPPKKRPRINYQPVYDLGVFTMSGGMPPDDQISRVSRELSDPKVRVRLAVALYEDERYSDAATEYVRLVEKRPQDPDLHLSAANALEKSSQGEAAYKHYLTALRLNPDLARHRFETQRGAVFRDGARMLLGAGRNERGMRWLEKAVQLQPHDLEAANNLGILYGKAGENAKAKEVFDRMLEMRDDYPPAYLQIGLFLQREGKHAKAIERMERYLLLAPNAPNRRAVQEAIRFSRESLSSD
ncbi:MAG TPA: hypothetical protein DHW45_15955 [Candidatus Latescibacteria bacterium]|nr:hypothetical protein [Candidatus Latescibacterota bacterium]